MRLCYPATHRPQRIDGDLGWKADITFGDEPQAAIGLRESA